MAYAHPGDKRTALTAHLVLTEAQVPSKPLIDQACRTLHDRLEIEHSMLQIEPPEGVHCRRRPSEALYVRLARWRRKRA